MTQRVFKGDLIIKGGKFEYQREEKESNGGDLIMKAHALSLTYTTVQAERERELKKNSLNKVKKLTAFLNFFMMIKLVNFNPLKFLFKIS